MKTVFPSSGKVFLNEFFIPASQNGFSVWWKDYIFIQSNVEAFEIRRWQFLLVKTDFLASKTFFPRFSDTPSSKSYLPSNENRFLNKSTNSQGGDVFSVLWKLFSLIWSFFLLVETVTETSGNPFVWGGGESLFALAESDFLSSENCSFIPYFFPASQKRYWK